MHKHFQKYRTDDYIITMIRKIEAEFRITKNLFSDHLEQYPKISLTVRLV